MNGPRFIILGFPRCGSTSANTHLSQHPNVEVLSQLNFFNFDEDDKRWNIKGYNSGIDEYKKYFIPGGSDSVRNLPKNNKKTIIGERTVGYITNEIALSRIHLHYPNIKLIIFIREPISRAYSQYNQFCLNKQISNIDFYTWVINENSSEDTSKYAIFNKNSSEDTSKYDIWLKNIFNLFPRENIYIAIAEQVLKNPLEEYNKIFTFIQAEKLKKINFDNTINKKSYKEPISNETFKKLYSYYKKHIEETYKLIGFRVPEWENKYKNI